MNTLTIIMLGTSHATTQGSSKQFKGEIIVTKRGWQRDKLLARLRSDQRLWDGTNKSDQISRMIAQAKRLNESSWNDRVKRLQDNKLSRWFAIQ
jgi:hypothetical protein